MKISNLVFVMPCYHDDPAIYKMTDLLMARMEGLRELCSRHEQTVIHVGPIVDLPAFEWGVGL